MKMCRRDWWVGLIALSATLSGCDQPEPAGTVIEEVRKVHFLSARGDLQFENGQRLFLARLMAGSPHFSLQVHDAGFKASSQLAQFKEAVADKPFAILVDPLEPKSLVAEVKAAVSSGIMVIGLGESSQDLGFSTVILTDQYRLGQLAGELTVHALLSKAQSEGKTEAFGRVVEIRGDDESPMGQRRHAGFEAALKTAPGVILVHDAPGDWTKKGGHDRALDALRLQQSFDVVYAHNDLMAFGTADALKDRRSEVLIIGCDGFRGLDGGMTLVGDGEIDASVYQPLLVDFAWQLLKKKSEAPEFTPKARYELTSRLITPKDVDDIRRNGLPPHPEM